MKHSIRLFVSLLVPVFMLVGVAANPAMAQDKAKGYERKVLLDNAKVVVTRVTTKPGGESDSRLRNTHRVVYVLKGGTQERIFADGKKEINEYKTGETRYAEPDKAAYKIKNTGKTDIVIQRKPTLSSSLEPLYGGVSFFRPSNTFGSRSLSPQTWYPSAARLRDLIQNVPIRSPRSLEDAEAVIGAFQPMHRPPPGQRIDDGVHQIAPAKRVAGAVQA